MSLASEIKRRALDAGFDLVGIAPVAAWRDLAFSQKWVDKGYGGEMHYLRNPKRADPRLMLPSAKSVVCVGLIYNTDFPYSTEATESRNPNPEPRPSRGWISRYAWGCDYHELIRAKLEQLRLSIKELAPGVETRAYVDTGPVVERAFARLSAIGWMGKNTCLINQEKGSWFFLGVILTSLEVDPDPPAFDRCGSCRRCLDACPTGALVEPYVMDASRCIAYFNIELKGPIPAEFRSAIGSNLFGCDICQDVCPWNRGSLLREKDSGATLRRQVSTTAVVEFQPVTIELQESTNGSRTQNPEPRRLSLFHPRLEDLASLGEEDFRRAFPRSPIKRVKYQGWLRNLCVVIGNSGDARFAPWLEKLRHHTDAIVREHAEWALNRLHAERSPAPLQRQLTWISLARNGSGRIRTVE